MFIGHFAAGLAAKKISPKTPLPLLVIGVQLVDLLWPLFVLIGWERVAIVPGDTAVTPLEFLSYPITHSFVTNVVWGLAFGAIVYAFRRDRNEFWLLAGLVVSHWVLDVLAHRPDMPIVPGWDVKIGLGLWNSLPATLVVEFGSLAAGTAVYLSVTKAKDRVGVYAFWGFIAFLVVSYLGNLFGPPPPSVQAIGILGNAMWLLVLWAWWIERHRAEKTATD